MSETLSYYQQEALKFLVAQQNKKESEASSIELELAKKFDDYSKLETLKIVGIDKAEEALRFNYYNLNALKLICKNKDGANKNPSQEDIELAQKFTNYTNVKALEVLDREKADLALTFNPAQAEALHVIYKGTSLTDDEIQLALKFTRYHKTMALKVLGVEQAALVLTLTENTAGAISVICKNADGSYRKPSDEDFALAKRFTNNGQVQAFEVLGKDAAETALTFKKGASGYALKNICRGNSGSYRKPSDEDLALAKRFTEYGQVNALSAINNTDTALALDEVSGEALYNLWRKLGNHSAISSQADIDLAKRFKLDMQVQAINILPNSEDALKVITNRQLAKLQEYGPSELERALEEGKKEVEALNYDEELANFKKLSIEHYQKEIKTFCKYKEMLSTFENCLQNLEKIQDENEDKDDNTENPEIDSIALNIADAYILKNQDTFLASTGNPGNLVGCAIIQSAHDLCDTHTGDL